MSYIVETIDLRYGNVFNMFNMNIKQKYLQDPFLQKVLSVRVGVLVVPGGGEESELAEGEAAGVWRGGG